MIRRSLISTLFPYTRSSDLEAVELGIELGMALDFVLQGIEIGEQVPAHAIRVDHAQRFRLARNLLVLGRDRKSTRLNSSHITISYAVFCLKKKKHRDAILSS